MFRLNKSSPSAVAGVHPPVQRCGRTAGPRQLTPASACQPARGRRNPLAANDGAESAVPGSDREEGRRVPGSAHAPGSSGWLNRALRTRAVPTRPRPLPTGHPAGRQYRPKPALVRPAQRPGESPARQAYRRKRRQRRRADARKQRAPKGAAGSGTGRACTPSPRPQAPRQAAAAAWPQLCAPQLQPHAKPPGCAPSRSLRRSPARVSVVTAEPSRLPLTFWFPHPTPGIWSRQPERSPHTPKRTAGRRARRGLSATARGSGGMMTRFRGLAIKLAADRPRRRLP